MIADNSTILISNPTEWKSAGDDHEGDAGFLTILTDWAIDEVLQDLAEDSDLLDMFRSMWTNDLAFTSDLEFSRAFFTKVRQYSIEDFDISRKDDYESAIINFIELMNKSMTYHLGSPDCKSFIQEDDYVLGDKATAAAYTWLDANDMAERDDSLAIFRKTNGGFLQVKAGQFMGFQNH